MIESDITDHYVENNTSIQDQVALRPEMITTHGFIGELNDIAPAALQPLQTIADKLTIINAYTPVLSTTALIAYNEAFQAYQLGANAVGSAVAAWSSLTGTGGESVIGSTGIQTQPNQNKQQTAFQQFYGYWRNRTLFTVQTPWAVFQNMAIQSLKAIQDEKTNIITDFEVSFKMIRFASTTAVTLPTTQQGRLQNQSSPLVNNGVASSSSGPSLSAGSALSSNNLTDPLGVQ